MPVHRPRLLTDIYRKIVASLSHHHQVDPIRMHLDEEINAGKR